MGISAKSRSKFNQVGPSLLGLTAFFGVFARGLVNVSFGLLALWGLVWVLSRPWRNTSANILLPPPLPQRWLAGIAIYSAITLLAIVSGQDWSRGLRYLSVILYLLATLPLAWLAFSQNQHILKWLPFLYGVGLMVTALLTFQEAGYRLTCLRAKAHLGIIELTAVLAQLAPLMLAALLRSFIAGRWSETTFFLLALLASAVAILHNCSRITMLTAPLLSLLIIWVYRRTFTRAILLGWLLLAVIIFAIFFLNPEVISRFLEIFEGHSNYNNFLRLTAWKHGWAVFKEHPLLGIGPAAVPSFLPETIGYYHTHHLFINILAESGVVGLVAFLALHASAFTLIWPHRRSPDPETFFWVWAAIIVNLQLLLNGLVDQVFTLKPMMYIYWVITAAALWQVRAERRLSQR